MTNVRLLNATSTGERLTFEEPAIDLARLDRMPREMRWAFQESATKLSTRALEAHLQWSLQNHGNSNRTIAKLREHEKNEIAVQAGEYRAQCGTPYPHVAAGVSIQRYGELGPSKHPPKNYGRPVMPQRRGRRRRRVQAMVG